MIKVYISGNFFFSTNPDVLNSQGDPQVLEEFRVNVKLKQRYQGENLYSVKYADGFEEYRSDKPYQDFLLADENGMNEVPFASESEFRKWFHDNTGDSSIVANDSSGGGDNPIYVTQQPVMRTDVSVPAGFRSVTIMRLGGNITVDIGDGTNRLGGGSNPRAITIDGDVFGDSYGVLPAITITGGSWQWIATPQI